MKIAGFARSSLIRARIEPELKHEAEIVLHKLGITPPQAIKMLYKRTARDHESPLELKVPNKKTRIPLEETETGISLNKSKTVDDLFDDLEI